VSPVEGIAQWSSFLEAVEGIIGVPLADGQGSQQILRDEAVDSLSMNELGMYLLADYGLDLFNQRTFAAARDLTLRELFERASATRAAA
jgi:hypothetical protein